MDAQPPVEPAAPPIGNPFEHACERCGTYAPLSAKYGPELCAECIERTAHPIVQTPTGVGDVLRGVFQLLRVVGLPGALIVGLAGVPISIVQYFAPELPFAVSSIWDFLVGTLADMVVLHLAWQAITKREQRVSIGVAFSAVGRQFGSLLGTRFVCNFVTLIFLLLLIVPGVMKALSLTLAMPITLHEGSDASAAMASSTARMRGHRGVAFLAYCVAGGPFLALLSVIICLSVAQGVAQGLGEQAPVETTSAFYEAAMFAIGLLTPVALLPVGLVPAVLYAKLRQPEYGVAI